MNVENTTAVSPFLDEANLKQFELRPGARQILIEASRQGRIATSEISSMFPGSLMKDRSKFPLAVEWIARILKAINVKIYVGTPEEIEERRAKRIAERNVQGGNGDGEAPRRELLYRPLPQQELEAIRTIDDNVAASYDADVPSFYREIRRYPLLSFEEVTELGKQVRDNADLGARNKLVLHNMRLSLHVARKYLNRGLDYDDLVQEGNVGLMTAADRYDYTQGFQFSTYAYWWVRQSITRAIQNQANTIRIPVHAQELRWKVLHAAEDLAFDLGREATVEEIAAHMGEEAIKVKKTLESLKLRAISLDNLVALENGDVDDMHDIIPDETTMDPVTRINAQDELEIATKKVSDLLVRLLSTPAIGERDREVFKKFYGLDGTWEHNRTLEEIGNQFGITRERIRQLIANTWKILKIADPSMELEHDGLMSEFERIARLETIVGNGAVLTLTALSQKEKDAIVERIALAKERRNQLTPENYPLADAVCSDEPELVQKVLHAVCDSYSVSMEAVLGDSRKMEIVLARHVAMYLLRTDLKMSFPKIAVALRRDDHTTIIHGYEKIKNVLEMSESVRGKVEKVRSVYQAALAA